MDNNPRVLHSTRCSTNRPKMNDDDGVTKSSDGKSISLTKSKSPVSPIVQTADSKQWIDLDLVSPKLLKEIRRQYDPSFAREPTTSIARSAAKIKAWARQSKPGIDIGLRRKVSDGREVVADIQLLSDQNAGRSIDAEIGSHEGNAAVLSRIPELAGTQIYAHEMPDNSVALELDSSPPAPRSASSVEIGREDTLPRYEPRRSETQIQHRVTQWNWSEHPFVAQEDASSQRPPSPTSHLDTSAHSSIVNTPVDGLSLADREDQIPESLILSSRTRVDSEPSEEPKTASETQQSLETQQSQGLQNDIGNIRRELLKEKDFPDLIAALLQALQDRKSDKGTATTRSALSPESKLGDRNVEDGRPDLTDEPADTVTSSSADTSPVRNKKVGPRASRKKVRAPSKRTKSAWVQRKVSMPPAITTEGASRSTFATSEATFEDRLLRRNTVSVCEPTDTGSETLWAFALEAQAKILGPEHPLVYQARSDLASSRVNGHRSINCSTFHESKLVAVETLGAVHPLVSSFSNIIDSLSKTTAERTKPQAEVLRRSLPRINTDTESDWSSLTRSKSSKSAVGPSRSRREGAKESQAISSISSTHGSTKAKGKSRVTFPMEPSPPQTQPELSIAPADNIATPSADSLQPFARPFRERRSGLATFSNLVILGIANSITESAAWLRATYGPEPPIEAGKVRVRWTCTCGEELYDDFIERRAGAARELEAYLNGQRTHMSHRGSPASSSNSSPRSRNSNSPKTNPPSSTTSWSSEGLPDSSMRGNGKFPTVTTTSGLVNPMTPLYEPPWLLTCANESIGTPKLAHLDMTPFKIRSDKDLAIELRSHYAQINKKWWRPLRLRGLTSLEFVQFEVHQNRFADIRKCPDMPPVGGEYDFEPGDLLPPVGSTYLMHLFRHPEDYEGEMIAYFRTPKKNGRLHFGVGWGISLVEGFLADRVWILASGFFIFASLLFAVAWECKKHNLQSAFGVASWILGLAVMAVGCLQARLG